MRFTSSRIIVLTLIVLLASAVGHPSRAANGKPVSYGTTWTDANGTPHKVSFQGQVDGTTVTGTLQVDTVKMQITGVVAADGSVAGTIVPEDASKPSGTFEGRLDGESKNAAGSYRVGTVSGSWTAPAATLAAAEAP